MATSACSMARCKGRVSVEAIEWYWKGGVRPPLCNAHLMALVKKATGT